MINEDEVLGNDGRALWCLNRNESIKQTYKRKTSSKEGRSKLEVLINWVDHFRGVKQTIMKTNKKQKPLSLKMNVVSGARQRKRNCGQ